MIRTAILACLCAVLAGCAGARAPVGTEAVTADYAAGGGQYDDASPVVFLVRAFEQCGMAGLCGVRTHRATGRTFIFNEMVARAASAVIAGDRIAGGLRDLPEARWRDDMSGATARCFLTDRPWRPEYATVAPEIRMPRLRFPEGDGGGFGLGWGGSVSFRQAPVPRPLP